MDKHDPTISITIVILWTKLVAVENLHETHPGPKLHMNSTASLNWNPALILTVGHLVAPQPTLTVLCQTTYTMQKEDDDMFEYKLYSIASFPG